jgi:hypothetical protein
MAHYAYIDENNVVTLTITGRDEWEIVDGITDWEEYYGQMRGQRCLRTSYGTFQGEHRRDEEPFRGNYAGPGMVYHEELDAFIDPQPFPSWTLNTTRFRWDPPVPLPSSGGPYTWDEDAGDWVIVNE